MSQCSASGTSAPPGAHTQPASLCAQPAAGASGARTETACDSAQPQPAATGPCCARCRRTPDDDTHRSCRRTSTSRRSADDDTDDSHCGCSICDVCDRFVALDDVSCTECGYSLCVHCAVPRSDRKGFVCNECDGEYATACAACKRKLGCSGEYERDGRGEADNAHESNELPALLRANQCAVCSQYMCLDCENGFSCRSRCTSCRVMTACYMLHDSLRCSICERRADTEEILRLDDAASASHQRCAKQRRVDAASDEVVGA